jgi:hypothetical protein
MSNDEIDRLVAPFWRADDGRSAAERAAAYGIDLSQLEENQRLPPEERIRQNDLVLTEAEHLIAARERTDPYHQATR